MPISFACDCGKKFSVGDGFAGKRTKCPTCGEPLTVPAPTADPDPPAAASEEDAAYRALMDAPEPEPLAAPARRAEPPARSDPRPPAPIPGAKRGPKVGTRSADDAPRRSRGTSGIHITPAVAGGALSMLIAAVWFGLGWAGGRIYFYPPIMFLFGLVAVVRGLLGYSEE